ncbi:MAG: DUF4097 family beta strand repeat-containing protein [Thermoanaerobaculia bacterium]
MKKFLLILFLSLNLFSFEETFKKEVPLKDLENLRVVNVNGNIEISGEERDSILIEAIKRAERQSHLKNLEIIIGREGKELKIETKHTRSYFLGFLPVKMGGTVNYKIKAPKNLKLKIETVNGNVRVENISSFIEAESVNGDIWIKEASGKGAFETVNGEIKIEIKEENPELKIESVNGNIFLKSTKKINAKYYLEVVNGKIKIVPSLMEIKSSSPKEMEGILGNGVGKLHIETVNGDITIETGQEFSL